MQLDLSMAPDVEPEANNTPSIDLATVPAPSIDLDLSVVPDQEEPGVLSSAGRGIAHGTLGLGEAGGSAVQYLGNRMIQKPRTMPVDLSEAWKQLTPGQRDETVMRMNELEEKGTPHQDAYRQALEDQYGARISFGPGADLGRRMAEAGQKTARYFNEWASEYAIPESLQGSILDKPELLLKASWWAYGVGDMVPSLAVSMVPAAGTAKAIQVGGRALEWTPALIQRVALLGAAVTGGVTGGGLEGAHTYQEVLRAGGSEEEAARAGELMTLFSAGLNSLSMGKFLSKAGSGIKGQVIKHAGAGAVEGTTEWLEEGADVIARDLGKYLAGEEVPDGTFTRVAEALRNGINILPIAAVTGVGGSVVMDSAVNESGQEIEQGQDGQEQAAQTETSQDEAGQEVDQVNTPAAEDVPVFTREDARQGLEEHLGQEESEAVMELWDMRAEAWAEQTGKAPDQWFEESLADIWKGAEAQFQGRQDLLYQGQDQAGTEEVMGWLKPLQDGAENALPMIVTDDISQWPEHVQQVAQAEGVDQGYVYDEQSQQIYLTADAVQSPEQAAAIWFHEQGLHHGIRGLMQDDAKLDGFLDAAYAHFGEETFTKLAAERNLDLANIEHQREAAEEMLAVIAEKVGTGENLTGEERKTWTDFIRMIWDWMRGRDIPLISDQEIARVVRDSVRWTMGKGGQNVLYQPAYHGSPYRFDKFTLDAMGKGEGAQAYGWGLYFAGEKAVADYYRKSLSSRHVPDGPAHAAARILASKYADQVNEKLAVLYPEMSADDRSAAIQEAKSITDEKGQLYEVEIPENDALLHWDIPLSKQPEPVRNALNDFKQDFADGALDDYLERMNADWDELTGQELYTILKRALMDDALPMNGPFVERALENGRFDEAASRFLNNEAVFGIKYLDGSSRADGVGSHNYVIFDDSAIDVLQTFYQPGQNGNRAAVEFLDDARAIIRLFDEGDVSAVVHETGHILRRQLPETDQAVVEKHFGVEDGHWTREAEEKFADTFERYVYEEKAPTHRLRLVLNRLRTWLVRLYGKIRNLRAESIHDDVRAVFDRLLTTEKARQAEKDPASPVSSFKVAPEVYGVDDVLSSADVVAMKSFDDVEAEAQRRAFAHADKEKRKLERALRAEWRKEAMEQVGEMRLFQVLDDYTGVINRGTKDQRSKMGLDIHLVRQDFGEETAEEIRKKRPGLLRNSGGAAYDTVATAYGYNDGEEMIRDLVEGPTKKQFIENHIQEREDEHEFLKATDDDYGAEYAAIQHHALDILEKLTKRQTQKIKTAQVREDVGNRRVAMLGRTRYAMRREREKLYNQAKVAYNQGRPDEAHIHLTQMHNLDMQLREVERAMAERDKIQNSIQYNLRRNIPFEYKEQLQAFLARFGMARSSGVPSSSLLDFLSMKGIAQWMDVNSVRYLQKVQPGALTVAQLREIDPIVKTIVYWGDHEGKLLAGEEMRDYQEALETMLASIIQSRKRRTGLPDPRNPEPPSGRRKSPFEKFLRGVDSLHGFLLKPEFIFRAMDGFKEFGPVWSEMFQPLKVAEDRELDLGGRIFAELEAAFKPFQKQFGKWGADRLDIKYTVKDQATQKDVEQTLPVKLTREEVIMVALNSGNEGNRNAILKGFKWDQKQFKAVLSMLTKEEWKLVHKVWKTIDSIYPHLNEMHMKIKGVPLNKVKGAYFPLMFDRELSWKADKFAEMAANRDLFQGIYSKPKPNDPMVKDRKGGVMPPLLSFRVITRHVTDAVHLATHGVPIRDVQKLLSDPNFRTEVERTWGEGSYRQLAPWLQNIAKPQREPMTIVEKWAGRLRMNTTVVSLGLKVSVAMKQFLSFTQTIDELGFKDAVKGLGLFMREPWAAQEFVNQRSLAMRNRRRKWDREVQAMYSQFNPAEFKGKQAVRDAFFWMIGLVDAVATYPTWMAAYEKGMTRNNWDEAKAVEYADMVVRRTQPVSAAKDLAEAQRGSNLRKLGTMFYTFFSVFTNRFSEMHSRIRHDPSYTAKDAFKSYFWLLIVPAILGDAISRRELPKDKWDYVQSIGGYALAGVPFIRDITSPILTGFDYSFSPVQDALEAPSDLWRAVNTKKDRGRKVSKQAVMAAGYMWGLPSRQITIAVDGALDLAQGKTNSPSRLLFPEKWEDKKNKKTKSYTFSRR